MFVPKKSRSNHLQYGVCGIGGRMWKAHRLSYTIFCGAIPKGMNVLHNCDVTLCVNPDHLFLGTQLDNVADMIRKGRKAPRKPDHTLRGKDLKVRRRKSHYRGKPIKRLAKPVRQSFK
jgi:hypothetical protein